MLLLGLVAGLVFVGMLVVFVRSARSRDRRYSGSTADRGRWLAGWGGGSSDGGGWFDGGWGGGEGAGGDGAGGGGGGDGGC